MQFRPQNARTMRLHNRVNRLAARQIMREAEMSLPRLTVARIAARAKHRPGVARADALIDTLQLNACRLRLLDQRERKSRVNRSTTY